MKRIQSITIQRTLVVRNGQIGNFYNGTIRGISAGIQWRNQPNLNIRLRAELNNINLPGKYGSTKLLLIAPRVEYNFNTQLFWTTFIQYNGCHSYIRGPAYKITATV